MDKLHTFGVQVEPLRTRAIEVIAFDRAVQAIGMSAVHAQLMRSPRMGKERNARFSACSLLYFVLRNSFFTMLKVYNLSRSVG